MNKLLLVLLALTAIKAYEYNWAVLVAGSNGYSNYRHQSDIFHTYQILIKNGMDPNKIIVFAYDDIANSSSNPYKGQVFNRPDGEDVYAGVKIDYSGKTVIPANFIKVLKGDKTGMAEVGSGKVLESTENDNVFIYFSDHGSSDLLAFPSGYLYGDELNETLHYMYDNKMYNEMTIYIEACYSGSMFEEYLTNDIKIYATTAANAHQSSYAYYCGTEAKVKGKYIGSCLGDEYSINWMEHTESISDLSSVTLQTQYEVIKSKTIGSEVMQYGDLTIAQEPLSHFQAQTNLIDYFLSYFNEEKQKPVKDGKKYRRVKNIDMNLFYYKQRAQILNDEDAYNEYLNEIQMTARTQKIFELFKMEFDLPEFRENKVDFKCLKNTLKYYSEFCGINIDRDHYYLNYLSSFCSKGISPLKAYYAFKDICTDL